MYDLLFTVVKECNQCELKYLHRNLRLAVIHVLLMYMYIYRTVFNIRQFQLSLGKWKTQQ